MDRPPRQPGGISSLPASTRRVSRRSLRIDRLVRRIIFAGGLGVILTISGIFLFILIEVLPLFSGAKVRLLKEIPTGLRDALLLGTDEWTARPFILSRDGTVTLLDLSGQQPPKAYQAPLPEGSRITSVAYLQERQMLALGLSQGQYLTGRVFYALDFTQGSDRTIQATLEWDSPETLCSRQSPVTAINLMATDRRLSIAGIVDHDGQRDIHVQTLVSRRRPLQAAVFVPERESQLTIPEDFHPSQVLLGADAQSLVLRSEGGEVCFYQLDNGQWQALQRFRPFEDPDVRLASMDFLPGEISLSFTSTGGDHVVHSLYRSAAGQRRYGKIKTLPDFPGGADRFAPSLRNKAFVIANENRLSLRYATTADVRWESSEVPEFQHLRISGKFDRLLGLRADGVLNLYELDDPHPEAHWTAFFLPIWYEGQDGPRYMWQSTGGTDDFEPKLSLIPLIIGSLKGTFYALIMAIPIALLAAIYTSQFLSPRIKSVVKPVMEIMASLPSVVLGFLAGLWLAPLIEDRVPSVLLMTASVPLSAVLFGAGWSLIPYRTRASIRPGWEFLPIMALTLLVALLAWQAGPLLEAVFFRVTDPDTGRTVADFRLWWDSWSESQFQQRNSLVVGFVMGYAVIPIIFTIAEDSLSAVPLSMRSGSFALGASRWQTTARIILPAASAGIFSACMIGFGRAVGETMIVVMATGNTPIMDLDLFSGMRTLSANIAIELPEAPHGSTLYRTLFLGAFVLFVLTFLVNTLAEFLRYRLRQRFH